MKYVALLRGINVGGKNKLPMSELRACLEALGFSDVSTLLNSGNALFETSRSTSADIAHMIEQTLKETLEFDSAHINVLVLSERELRTVLDSAPAGFGKHPKEYHSDVVFVIHGEPAAVAREFTCNPDVDTLWVGKGAVFYRRLSSQRTKSRLSNIVGKPVYKNLTIRTWNTVTKILARMEAT